MKDSKSTSPGQSISEASEMFGSFFLNDSEFALHVKSIQEVVNPPAAFTTMPLAPAFLLGIFNLRGSIIPVVDVGMILNLTPDNLPIESKKIAVIEHDGVKLGLLFQSTGQIFRHKPEERSEFNYTDADLSRSVISGAIKLDNGQRILQILNVPALVQLEKIPHAHCGDNSAAATKKRLEKRGSRLQCISFLVNGNRSGLGMDAIHEIIKVPKLNASALTQGNCLGMFELRGDVVPVLDFSALLGYREPQTAQDVSEDQRIIIMKIGAEKFGLLVDSVDSIVSYYSEDILSLPVLNPEKSGMFIGCLSKQDSPQDLILFNHTEILSSAEINQITHGHSSLYQASAARGRENLVQKGQRKTYITFKIDTLLALEIGEVREIIDFPKELLTPPGLAKAIRGMLNLRGEMVAILDTRALYSSDKLSDTTHAKILVFQRKNVMYGMIVDSVENIINVVDGEKMLIPVSLQRGNGKGSAISQDVKFAFEVTVGEVRQTLMVLNLDPLTERMTGDPLTIEQSA